MRPIRIGQISFLNALPVYHDFDDEGLSIEWVQEVPAKLNRKMAEGAIDVSAISSFAYAKHFPQWVLLPNLSVSAISTVGSIFLFTKGEGLREIRNRRIALSNASATSVHLLRVLLEYFEGGRPEYVTCPPDLPQMMETCDAALLIGDDALYAKWNHSPYRAFDLGEEWFRRTQQSMTFAVWAVRREIAETRKTDLQPIYLRLIESKRKALQKMTPIVRQAQQKLGFGDEAFWRGYFENLRYDFHENEWQGLSAYYDYLAKLGVISPDVEIKILDLPIGIK